MQAKDVMTTSVATIGASATVKEAAALMLDRRVSGLPVTLEDGRIAGILSEGDLVRRAEIGTDRQDSWWLRLLSLADENAAAAFVKTHATRVADVMTTPVISASEETPVEELALLLDKHRIKRLPVLRGDRIVGIVSRADLVRRLAMAQPARPAAGSDRELREKALAAIARTGVATTYLNVMAESGVLHLWGAAMSQAERKALLVAAEEVAGPGRVEDHLMVVSARLRGALRGT